MLPLSSRDRMNGKLLTPVGKGPLDVTEEQSDYVEPNRMSFLDSIMCFYIF